MFVSMTMLHHERYQGGLVVMNMHDIGVMVPFTQPVNNRDLEGRKPERIVVVSIYFFAVQEAIDVDEVQIKSGDISGLFDNSIVVALIGDAKTTFMHHFKCVFK